MTTTTTRNEAAERLEEVIRSSTSPEDLGSKLIAFMEDERAATVKRIRGPVHAYLYAARDWIAGKLTDEQFQEVRAEFDRILDEVSG